MSLKIGTLVKLPSGNVWGLVFLHPDGVSWSAKLVKLGADNPGRELGAWAILVPTDIEYEIVYEYDWCA